jgi:hypothetical protein
MSQEKQPGHGIRFAWHRPTERMVSPAEVQKGLACDCICVACKSPLVARKGEIRIAHFAHHRDSDCPYAAEAAIHWMAKQMIAEKGSIFAPHRSLSKTVFGKRRVWEETLSLVVQPEGLIEIQDCKVEKNILGASREQSFRRPDLIAQVNGMPLAIEICNTHAVDFKKEKWLEEHGYSVLEIDVSDLASLPTDSYKEVLEQRLFIQSKYSRWLVHLLDKRAAAFLADLEHELRLKKKPEEDRILADLEADEEKRRKEAARRQKQLDVEEFKVRFGECTVRLGLNEMRATLKAHGHASTLIISNISMLAKHYCGRFNGKARRWEFYRSNNTKPLFNALRLMVVSLGMPNFQESLKHPAATEKKTRQPISVPPSPEPTLREYFANPALQELFDERAGMLEYDAGLNRAEAEKQAFEYVSASAVQNAAKPAERLLRAA